VRSRVIALVPTFPLFSLFQVVISADYETPKDLVSRLPLLTEENEDEEDDDDDDSSTTRGGSSPNISLLTGLTSLTSIDGAVIGGRRRGGRRAAARMARGTMSSSGENSSKSSDRVCGLQSKLNMYSY
jgi:hypothetical protein